MHLEQTKWLRRCFHAIITPINTLNLLYNIKVARYNEAETYTEDMYEDFYPGTENMSSNECVKYMRMGKDVLLSMNSSNRFIGAFIKGNNVELKLIG